MKTEYKNLKELRTAIDNGDIEGAKLSITLDNDTTYYEYDDGSDDGQKITIESAGNGYYDYEELYQCYFPKSRVDFC